MLKRKDPPPIQGQFYGVTLEYRSNPAEALVEDLTNVKSIVMLVFRDAKNPEDELNAWEFWHQVSQCVLRIRIHFESGSRYGSSILS
jgi:hypothetical protein